MDKNKDIVATYPSHEDAESDVKELQQSGFDEVLALFEPNQSDLLILREGVWVS